MENVPEIVNSVYQTFIDYFGEYRVDLQEYFRSGNADSIVIDSYDLPVSCYAILVHWDEVTVTNEYDESIDIWDLYSASLVSSAGKLIKPPLFTRSTYDLIQWEEGYCHSHVMTLNRDHCERFVGSCLGSGPIRATISRLKEACDLDVWTLYCWELDKYVHVESLSGGPYRRLRDVGKRSNGSKYLSDFKINPTFYFPSSRTAKDATKKLFNILLESNILKYNFIGNKFTIGTPYADTVLAISNAFIDWFNTNAKNEYYYTVKDLFDSSFLEKGFIVEGCVLRKSENNNSTALEEGRPLFKFKGEPVKLQPYSVKLDYNAGELTLVNSDIINYILYRILNYLNINYGNSDAIDKKTRII